MLLRQLVEPVIHWPACFVLLRRARRGEVATVAAAGRGRPALRLRSVALGLFLTGRSAKHKSAVGLASVIKGAFPRFSSSETPPKGENWLIDWRALIN